MCRRVSKRKIAKEKKNHKMFNNRIFIILALVAVVQLEISSTNGSVIKKRSLAEDLRTGINLAGKIFGTRHDDDSFVHVFNFIENYFVCEKVSMQLQMWPI